MKRYFIGLAAVLLMPLYAAAQDAGSRIALTPYVCYDIESIPRTASSALERKLTSMATANGFAGMSDRFLLTAIPEVMSVSMTPTAPAQFVVEVEVEVYVVNNPEEVIVGQTVYSLKGVGASEQKAVISAINQINVRSVETRRFLENARAKIIEYYDGRLPSIIAKAQSLASMTRYDEALAVLSAVPDCLDGYPQIAEMMVDIYTSRIDRDADSLIRAASAKLAADDATGAMTVLAGVDPYSTRASEADAMIAKIKADAEAEKQMELQKEVEAYEYERARAQKEYDDEVELKKLRLEVAREVATTAGEAMGGGLAGVASDAGKSAVKWLFGNLVK